MGAAGIPCFLLLDFELRAPRVWTLDELAPAGLRFSFPTASSHASYSQVSHPVTLSVDPPPYAAYQEAFSTVQEGLQRGDSFLTNLTLPVEIGTTASLAEIYHRSEAKYRILYEPLFVCFSPETFVTIDRSGYIESRPMKGTAVDTPAARASLMHSPKEIAEHATIVDLIRNDLSRVARRVGVTDYRYLRAIETAAGGLVQTSSRIGGMLRPDWPTRLGSTLLQLLPAGSVSGAPKGATLELIRRAEGHDRGYYCGVAGYFDGHSLDSCVLIRFVRREGARYFFHAGGGITAYSRAEDEYRELLAKIRIPQRL